MPFHLEAARSRLVRWSGALAIGAAAGYACSLLRTPIPWMLGPLLAIAIVRVAGLDIAAPPAARQIGQWIIGTSLGLYFTPQVIGEVGGLWHLLAAGAVFAIVVGYVSGIALARMAGVDRTTGVFASVPGGAAEMATLGERFGARVDRVAAAQSLRILIVVAVVPAAYALLGIHGSDRYLPSTRTFDLQGFVWLMAVTGAAGLLFQFLHLPNGFVLGSLAVAIPLTALELDLSAIPFSVSNTGQYLLGCALGSRFQPDFLRGAHRFVGAVVAAVILSMGLSALFGVGMAYVTGLDPGTLILGTAPGGIAEMSITANVLQLGVPLVTAFHVTRVVVLLLCTAPLFQRVRQWRRKLDGDDSS